MAVCAAARPVPAPPSQPIVIATIAIARNLFVLRINAPSTKVLSS
jgi:hypothetical protein